jgi:hypothetical protein
MKCDTRIAKSIKKFLFHFYKWKKDEQKPRAQYLTHLNNKVNKVWNDLVANDH